MSRLLDKIKIAKLENEIKILKEIPMIDLKSENDRLEKENWSATNKINTMNNLIALLLKKIGNPVEIDKAELYTEQNGFETCENIDNYNITFRYVEKKR